MCGRFLTPDAAAFERYWGLEAPQGYAASFNVAPSQSVAVMRTDPEGAARESPALGVPSALGQVWLDQRALGDRVRDEGLPLPGDLLI